MNGLRTLALLLAAACTDPALVAGSPGFGGGDGAPGITEVSEPEPQPEPDPELEPAGPGADELLVLEMLAGQADPADVMPTVAWSDGWPVETLAGTWIVVMWDDSTPWAVAGDHNGWVPTEMNLGDGFYWAEVEADPGAFYKFVAGPDTWIADPWARSYTYDDNGEISYIDAPADTWRLDRWPAFAGHGLDARTVRAYVPAGTGPWPTLYMHDGNNLFAPDAMWGGWRLQDTLATRDPMLVIGIDNTWGRMDEYTHIPDDIGYGMVIGGLGDAYAALVQEDLRPLMEAEYGAPSVAGVMGSSLGGLISLHIAHRYPGAYDFAGSMSGTLGWGRFEGPGPVMEELYLADGVASTVLYVDSGGSTGADGQCRDLDGDGFPEDDPDADDNYCTTRQFADSMATQGYLWGVDLHHWHEVGAVHNELFWADRVWRPLEIFAGLEN